MAFPGRARTGGPVLHPRLCAGVVLVSSAVHLWLALQNRHGVWLGALMVVLGGVCLPCAAHIWQHSRPGALHRVMGCALFMVAIHAVLLLGGPTAGHAHPGVRADLASAAGQAGNLLAVIGLELVTALLAATLVARLRAGQHARARRPSRSGAPGGQKH